MADQKISELNQATALFDSDDFAVVQDSETKQLNATLLKAYVKDGLSKTDVGLDQVDNSADVDKPISTAVQTALDSKQATTDKNAANGYAGLDANAKLPTSLLPALAISEYLGSVANQAARLALTGEKGDWCSQADNGKVYVITGDDPTSDASWTALTYPVTPGITLNGTSIAPGDTATITAATTNTLTIGTGLSGTSFNGSAAATIAIDSSVVTLTGTQTLTNKTLTSPAISGGTANNVAIGGTTPAAGAFTTLSSTGNTTLGDAAGDTLTLNGTAVSIPNNLNFDSNTLFIDAANNRVGIGTNSPGTVLQVNGGISPVTTDANFLGLTSNRYLAVYSRIWSTDNGISGWNIDGNTSPGYDLAWSFNGGEKVRFTTAGNVGIGTSSPDTSLYVASSGGSQKRAIHVASGNETGAAGGIYIETNNASGANGAVFEAIGKRSDGNGSAGFSGITALGHLRTDAAIAGAGQVLGSVWFGGNPSGTTTADVRYSASIIGVSDTAWSSSSAMGTALAFYTGASGLNINATIANPGTERMRIDSSGNVGIGTSSPAQKLDVNGDALIYGVTVGRGGGGISNNTASGMYALYSNTTGNYNTASGQGALNQNTTGYQNTASGMYALYSNTTGNSNTASGYQALFNNTTGVQNTASGQGALNQNTTGVNNTATGQGALLSNTTGAQNTASGQAALYSNTTGNYNTASGFQALFWNTTGSCNSALGSQHNTSGTYAPAFNCTTENNRVSIAHTGVTNAYVQVAWTVVSDARDKTNFNPIPHGLDFVNQLNPVSFQFRVDRDSEETNGNVRYGFKAQDILALEGDSPVIIDNENPDKLRYNGESLVPVLVNAIKELTSELNQLKSELNQLKG